MPADWPSSSPCCLIAVALLMSKLHGAASPCRVTTAADTQRSATKKATISVRMRPCTMACPLRRSARCVCLLTEWV